MSEAAVARVASRPSIHPYDRAFYTGIALAMLLAVFVGFSRTFYLRPMFTGSALSPLLHVHGALFTTWVLLFVAQTALVAKRRVDLHRRLGYFGAFLAAAMFSVGIFTAVEAARRGAAPLGIDPRGFMAIPLGDMALFGTLVFCAVWFRRNKESHKRLMLLAYIGILPAAFARWPYLQNLGPIGFFGAADLFIVVAAAYDFASRGKVHAAYVWGGMAIVLSQPFRLMLAGTETWIRFADNLIR